MDYEKQEKPVEDEQITDLKSDYDKDFNLKTDWKQFLISFFGILSPPIVLYTVAMVMKDDVSMVSMALLLLSTIPLMVIGFFLWAAMRRKNRPRALGFLFGGLLPFAILFIATDGCGLLW